MRSMWRHISRGSLVRTLPQNLETGQRAISRLMLRIRAVRRDDRSNDDRALLASTAGELERQRIGALSGSRRCATYAEVAGRVRNAIVPWAEHATEKMRMSVVTRMFQCTLASRVLRV